MNEAKRLPLGARIRFEFEVNIGPEQCDVKSITAVITKGLEHETVTMDSGIERLAKGHFVVHALADKVGHMAVRVTTCDGDTHRETYVVEAPGSAAPPPPPVAAARVDVAWPTGYDRARALSELDVDPSKSDAYLLGSLTQHLANRRADALALHDDRRPLPSSADEARAQDMAKATLKKAAALEFKPRNAKAEAAAIEDARRKVRIDQLKRR